jgi:hypothetical protein
MSEIKIDTTRSYNRALKDAVNSGAVQAWVDGKPIEYATNKESSQWTLFTGESPVFYTPGFIWRPAAEPKLRPWTRDEVPPGCVIRLKADHSYWVVVTARFGGLLKLGVLRQPDVNSPFDEIKSHPEKFEHSTDCGKTWHPCGVVEGDK